ncbi:SHOCT domain-containing protein [Prevotella histicola]|uniref:SHOCT domain-containing protein n=1 Tax=Prevotella histicola TaxID=470565 RepID=UPI001C5CCE3C|nr:SHOCT domain-containing protein [Prevotella histicola]MBW4758299.1 SHOCT domain-containing protein [Prevotella histicola]
MSKIKEDHISLVIDAKTDKAQQELRELERATRDLSKEMKTRQNRMLDLEAAGKKETAEYKNLQAEVRSYSKLIADNNKKLRELRSAMDVNAMTMSQLKKHAKELQKALNDTSKATNPQEYERLASELRTVNGRISDLKRDASGLGESMGKESTGIMGKFEGMFSSISGGWTKLVGVATAAVASISAVVEGAKWFYNYNMEVEEAQRLTREFFNIQGDELVHSQSQISALAKQFGKDYKEVLGTVESLTNQYGISISEAINAIKDGLQAGADLNGTFLSQIQQYGPAFSDAGASVKDLVASITQTRSGIFNEAGMGLIQTATNRIRTMSTATQGALNSIGISSKQLEADLISGKTSILEAIKMISGKIKELPENSMQVGQVMKAVFGKTASNEGLKLVKTLADMSTNMDELKGVTGEYGELQREEVEAQAELNEKMSKFFGLGENGFDELTMKAKIFGVKALSKIIDYSVKIINYFIDLYNESKIFRIGIEHVKNTFKNTWEVFKFGVNLVIDGFKGMGRMAKAWAKVIEGAFSFDVDKISTGIKGLWDAYRDTWTEIGQDAKKMAANVRNNFVDAINNTVGKKKVARISVDVAPDVKTHSGNPNLKEGKHRTIENGVKDPKKKKEKKKKTTDPDDIASKLFAHDRAQDLDAEKRSYDKSLNALKEALAKKTLTQEQYSAYVAALNIQHQNKLLDIEKTYLQRSENMVFKDAAKKKALHEGQVKAVADQQQAANTAYIEAEKEYYESLDQIQQAAPSKPQTLQQECDAKLVILDGYYKASLQRAKNNGEREKEVTEAYEAAKAAIVAEYEQKKEEERARAKQEYGLETFDEQQKAKRKKLDEDYAKGLLSAEEYEKAKNNLIKEAEEYRNQILQQYGLAKRKDIYQEELEHLKSLLQAGFISQQEYEEAVSHLRREKWKEDFENYKGLFVDAMQSLQQAEIANVDAKYDAEIEAAKNAGKDTTELEKKKADEKLKIQKKYADVNFAIQAAQIIASTASAIAKTFSELGFPAGIPAAALMGITGAAQLAAALAERNKVKRMTLSGAGGSASASGARVATGLESGGSIDVERKQDGKMFRADYNPDRRGFIDKPTVIVGEGGYGHSKEWVASNAAVENPTIAPFIDIIDRAQRAGTIRTLDMNKFLIQQAQGRTSGGYVTPTVNDVRGVVKDSYKDTLIERLTDVLDRLSVEGIPASVSLNEIEQKQQLQDKARRFGSK